MPFSPIAGFTEAVEAAADLEAFRGSTPDEYSRGQAELIAALFIADDTDPGSGEAYAFIEDSIKSRLR